MSEKATFGEVTAIEQAGESAYTAELDPLWTIGGKPNGGYLQAIMARAAVAAPGHDHPHPIAASTHYLRAPEVGPATLDVEVLRSGRSASQVHVRLSQEGVAKVDTVFTLADLSEVDGPQWQAAGLPEPGLVIEDCIRLWPPKDAFPQLFRQLGLYLEPESLKVVAGAPSGVGELRGWVQLPGDAPHDAISLLLAADVFPPATFDIKMTGWVPTLELSTYVRALPAPGPVQVVMRANLIQGDRVDETVTIRDTTGQVVAQSHQLAGIRFS